MDEKQLFEYLKQNLKIKTYMYHMSGILNIQLLLKNQNGDEEIISEVKEHVTSC